jgi:hypothetical protein
MPAWTRSFPLVRPTSRWVRRTLTLRLLPALYEVYNPMPYEAAREMEVELAIDLREAGYGVWQA